MHESVIHDTVIMYTNIINFYPFFVSLHNALLCKVIDT